MQAMKASLKTYELFYLAKMILEKAGRFVIELKALPDANGSGKLYSSVSDQLPFETEQAAVQHVIRHY